MHYLPQAGLDDFIFLGDGIGDFDQNKLGTPVSATYIELARNLPSLLDELPSIKPADVALDFSAPVFADNAPTVDEHLLDLFQDGLEHLIGCGAPSAAAAAPLHAPVLLDDAALAAVAAAVPAISVPSTPLLLHIPPPAVIEARAPTPPDVSQSTGFTREYVRSLSKSEYMALKKRTAKHQWKELEYLRGRVNNERNCVKSRERTKQRQQELQGRADALEIEVKRLRPLEAENQRLKAEIKALRRQMEAFTPARRPQMPM